MAKKDGEGKGKIIKIKNPISVAKAIGHIMESRETIMLVRSEVYPPYEFYCEVDISKLKSMIESSDDGTIYELPVNVLDESVPMNWLTCENVNRVMFFKDIPKT